jgi:hypothetical protein
MNIFIFATMLFCIGLAIYGCIKAGQNGDTGWMVGTIVGIFFGVGWIVALVYLVAIAPKRPSPSL